jgi:hypothetical protein
MTFLLVSMGLIWLLLLSVLFIGGLCWACCDPIPPEPPQEDDPCL